MSDDWKNGDLFGEPGTEPRARRTDPLTSHRAAAAARGWFKSHQGKMLRAWVEHGAGTTAQAAEWCDITYWQATRRVSELERLGLIVNTGRLGTSPSKQDAQIYEATAKGRDMVSRADA